MKIHTILEKLTVQSFGKFLYVHRLPKIPCKASVYRTVYTTQHVNHMIQQLYTGSLQLLQHTALSERIVFSRGFSSSTNNTYIALLKVLMEANRCVYCSDLRNYQGDGGCVSAHSTEDT